MRPYGIRTSRPIDAPEPLRELLERGLAYEQQARPHLVECAARQVVAAGLVDAELAVGEHVRPQVHVEVAVVDGPRIGARAASGPHTLVRVPVDSGRTVL